MNLRATLTFAAALLTLGAAPALAQSSSSAPPSDASSEQSTVPDELQGMVGDWQLEQEDQSIAACPMTLSDQQSIGGWAVQFPEPCQPGYPTDKIVTWNVDSTDGSVLLTDATRKVVLHLFEDEDGLFDTGDAIPKFYMLPPEDSEDNGGENDSDD